MNTNPLVPTTPDPGQFEVIMSDSPWKGMGGEKHYRTEALPWIRQFHATAVKELAAPDSFYFMWTTKALLDEAKEIMALADFEFLDYITWGKFNRIGFGDKRVGIRRASELLLVGLRGNAKAKYAGNADWFTAPVMAHSKKPHEQYAIVDRIAGMDARRLELFARHHQPGWDYWGDELESTVSLLKWGYPVPSDFAKQESEA